MRQRLINIYENLYKTNYIEDDAADDNIKINKKHTKLFINNNLIINLYSLKEYKLNNNINKIYIEYGIYDYIYYNNNNNYRIHKQIYGYIKYITKIIKYNNLINFKILKNFSLILKNKSIYLNNLYIILYCSYYKYNYNYYIFYNNKKIDNNAFNKINIIKNWFFIYIL